MLQLPLCAQDKCSGKYVDQSCSKLKCVQHKLETQEPSQSVLKGGGSGDKAHKLSNITLYLQIYLAFSVKIFLLVFRTRS